MSDQIEIWYALGRLASEFIKNRISDDVTETSFKFSSNIVDISISIKPTHFILGTNIQHRKVHLIVIVQMTLTDAEGHR